MKKILLFMFFLISLLVQTQTKSFFGISFGGDDGPSFSVGLGRPYYYSYDYPYYYDYPYSYDYSHYYW